MIVCRKTTIHGYYWADATLPVNANQSGDLMMSLLSGASRKVPMTLRLSSAPATQPGHPSLRWRAVRSPVGRGLLGLLLTAARPLTVWQRRLRDRDCLQRMPDYLLQDIGLDRVDVLREADKPFWRR